YFFFQAEDGIRDFHVTGVQTCALPIFEAADQSTDAPAPAGKLLAHERQRPLLARVRRMRRGAPERSFAIRRSRSASAEAMSASQIGRASCRERMETLVVDGGLKIRSHG